MIPSSASSLQRLGSYCRGCSIPNNLRGDKHVLFQFFALSLITGKPLVERRIWRKSSLRQREAPCKFDRRLIGTTNEGNNVFLLPTVERVPCIQIARVSRKELAI